MENENDLIRRFEAKGVTRDDLELFLQLDDPELREFFAGLRKRALNVIEAKERIESQEKIDALFKPYLNQGPTEQVMAAEGLSTAQATLKLFAEGEYDEDREAIKNPGKWFSKAPFTKAEFEQIVTDHPERFEVLRGQEEKFKYTQVDAGFYLYTQDGAVVQIFPVRGESMWVIQSGLGN